MNTYRENGCYWVKLNNVKIVATWVDEYWKIPGQYAEMMDEEFQKIWEERLPEPPDVIILKND